MSSVLPKFEDRHPAYDLGGFTCTNEEPETFRRLLRGKRRFKRAGAIASGGEIPLLVLLSRADEVFAVDHGYNALTSCYLKMALLVSMGPLGFRKFVCSLIRNQTSLRFDTNAVQREVNKSEIKAMLPEVLQTRIINLQSILSVYNFHREWSKISLTAIKYAHNNLHKLTFIHGDLSDLEGDLDLLYISNALEHTGRDHPAYVTGKYEEPNPTRFYHLVKDGGLVMKTDGKPLPPGWTKVRSLGPTRSGWTHTLAQRIAQP